MTPTNVKMSVKKRGNQKTGHPSPPQNLKVWDRQRQAHATPTRDTLQARMELHLLMPDLGLGELTQERHGLLRPPEDHQMGAALSSRNSRHVISFPMLAHAKAPSTLHAHWTGLAIPPHNRHHGWCRSRVEPRGTKATRPRPVQVSSDPVHPAEASPTH